MLKTTLEMTDSYSENGTIHDLIRQLVKLQEAHGKDARWSVDGDICPGVFNLSVLSSADIEKSSFTGAQK